MAARVELLHPNEVSGRRSRASLLGGLRHCTRLPNGLTLALGACLFRSLGGTPAHFPRISSIKTSHRVFSFDYGQVPRVPRGFTPYRVLPTVASNHSPRTQQPALARALLPPTSVSSAGSIIEHVFAIPNLQPITAVDGFDVKHVSGCQPQDSTHRCRHVLMHTVGELDHDHGPLARRPHKAPTDGS